MRIQIPSSVALALVFALLPLAQLAIAEEQPDWRRVSESDGIAVFSRKVAKSRVVALKAETTLAVPIGKIMTVMDQIERQPEWVPNLSEAKQLKYSSFYDRVVFTIGRAPWPVRDREFLVRSKLEIDEEQKTITARMESIEDPSVPVQRRKVRAWVYNSIIVVRSLENDTRTYFSIEVHSDPKGWIPKWVVNVVQRRWPRLYLMSLKAQLAKPDITEHPRRVEVLGTRRQ